ncbi:NAD(P)-dependent oxidoreductase [Nonomuraea sp. NPDC050786]|uniref:NAD-dependent epimerase/dehydratase family protein n=1 Tax=Nonomuraea sp. NPDC050786 TaxID=3154840 RepID=UPI00340F5F8C
MSDRIFPEPGCGTVLVTGGCGFLGRELVSRLLASGHHVRVLDDLSTGLGCPPGAELIVGSVLDPTAVRHAAAGVTALFHLAGVVGMRLATNQRRVAFDTTAVGTEVVLTATGDAPAILFSSSAVYGLNAPCPIQEDRPLSRSETLVYDGGQEGYATGKLELETLGATAARRGRPVLVLRPFNVVGAGQSAAYGMVLPTFVERAKAGLPLTIYDSGTQRRCFSGVSEFTDVVLRLVANPRAWTGGVRAVNIGSTHETTIRQLAELVLAATGSGSPIEHIPYASIFPGRTDVSRRVPNLDRLRELCGDITWPSTGQLVQRVIHDLAAAPVDRARAMGVH